MAFGLLESGFVNKDFDTILVELVASLKSSLGSDLNTSANSVAGQFANIFGLKVAELWEVLQALYSAFDPDFATGDALDRLGLLTGTPRLFATKSLVTATLNLNNGATVPAGSVASVVGSPASRFVTLDAVTNSSGVTANFSVDMAGQNTGPIAANSGTLTVIETPVTGWNSITNALDATLGTNVETDAAYRLRRVLELAGLGTGTNNAIRADLLNVANVISVTMFENDTDVTDGDGLLPHSFEALVYGGTDQAVADQIWLSKAAGIATNGNTSVNVTDSSGFVHIVKFTRPTLKNLFLDIYVITNALFPTDGEAQIEANIAAFAAAHIAVGSDVIINALYCSVFDVAGVEDVTAIYLYDASSLGAQNLSQLTFGTHTLWAVAGDFAFTGGNVVYTDSSHVGVLSQTAANLAAPLATNRWYAFTYTISGSTGAVAAVLTTDLMATSTALDLTNGTHTTYVHTGDVIGDFIISATSTSGGFTLTAVDFKIINRASANYVIGIRELAVIDTSRITVIAV